MINRLLLVNLLLLLFIPSFAQVMVRGKVQAKVDKKPIPFVNIGILNSSTGTISNSDGSFSINIPPSLLSEDLIFSAIGYETETIAVQAIAPNKDIHIYLNEKITHLDEIVIFSTIEKKKQTWLGNKKRNIMVQGQMHSDTTSAGGAMALLIEKGEDDNLNFLKQASLFITRNTLPQFKVRIRFLKLDSINNNLPGEDLYNKSIVMTSTIKRGWLNFDLSSYDFQIDQSSFYLMFEWILEDKDRIYVTNIYDEFIRLNPERIHTDTVIINGEKVIRNEVGSSAPIPGVFFGDTRTQSDLKKYNCFSRSNSFGKWKRSPGIVSAKILVSNQSSNNLVLSNENDTIQHRKSLHDEKTLDTKIVKWGEEFIDSYSIPGMQLTVGSKDNILFSKGFGYSDIENNKRVTTQTRFRIASVTKPITSAAMIKLASAGKLDLDAPVRHYVPPFPEKKYPITTRQLAGHLGGIRDYFEISIDEVLKNPHFENATEAIAVFKNDTLMSKPGDQFLYSSFGYNLIGAVIESVSGQTYLDYMQENIWEPLSMSATYGDIMDSTMINKSQFYYPNEVEAAPYDMSYVHPGGGLISTTEDLLKFGNELLFGHFFKDSFKNKLFETQYTSDKRPTNYGLGWYIGKDMNGHRIWFHVGQSPSSGAVLILYPDDNMVISLLTNTPILTNAPDGLPIEVQKLGELIYQK